MLNRKLTFETALLSIPIVCLLGSGHFRISYYTVHAHFILHTAYCILHTTYYMLHTTYYTLHNTFDFPPQNAAARRPFHITCQIYCKYIVHIYLCADASVESQMRVGCLQEEMMTLLLDAGQPRVRPTCLCITQKDVHCMLHTASAYHILHTAYTVHITYCILHTAYYILQTHFI
jgi:hypothetical protein